jgi:release factor glutamine methyltransferase
MTAPDTLHRHIQDARRRFERAGIEAVEAAIDADVLARHALGGWERGQLLAGLRDACPPNFAEGFEPLVRRREQREPTGYVTGHREFWNVEIEVGPGVLIPRPETELLVEEVLARVTSRAEEPVLSERHGDSRAEGPVLSERHGDSRAEEPVLSERRGGPRAEGPVLSERHGDSRAEGPVLSERHGDSRAEGPVLSERHGDSRAEGPHLRIADVGTGSGCLAVALARWLPGAHVLAIDVSEAALRVARRNAARHEVGDRVLVLQGDLLQSADGLFDVIVSNPPYVPAGDLASLQPEIREFEPVGALNGGLDGLDVIRRLVPEAATRLVPGGWLMFEFGFGQSEGVRAIMAGEPRLALVDLRADLAGIPRVAVARRLAMDPAPRIPDLESRTPKP